MTIETILIFTYVLLGLDVLVLLMIFGNKTWQRRKALLQTRAENFFVAHYVRNETIKSSCHPKAVMKAYQKFYEQTVLSDETKRFIYQDFLDCGLVKKNIKRLNCLSTIGRKTAASNLSFFQSPEIQYALINRLKIEKKANVKIYLINALKNQMNQLTLLALIDSVIGSKKYYQSRAIQIVKNYLLMNRVHIPDIFNRKEPEIKELFVDLAESVFRDDFKQALIGELIIVEKHLSGTLNETYSSMVESRVKRLYYRILTVLSNIYGYNITGDYYLKHSDEEVVKIAIMSLSKTRTFDQIKRLLKMANGTSIDNKIVEVIQGMVESNFELYLQLVEYFKTTLLENESKLIANVLSSKIEYLALKYKNSKDESLKQVLTQIIESGYTASLIAFLNVNLDTDLEKLLFKIIKPIAKDNNLFYQELNDYLEVQVLKRLGYDKVKTPPVQKIDIEIESSKIKWLWIILLIALLFFPLLFAATTLTKVLSTPIRNWIEQYVLMMSNSVVYYYLIVNGLYFILAILSAFGARKQRILWDIKSKSMLYEKGILGSISIIAPAYNEELSIVESVTSLLNLKYPDYEVIVVNDGSKDKTLEKLIEHFRLERRNIPIRPLINTKAIKAVYKNKNIPNLTIVDKINGGKADALNVGINTAKNEYVCGIDADSLLSPDALLKLMSSSLDHDEITLALGGNIFPVNGSEVNHGFVEKQGLSKNSLASLQTIEYLRAFTLGRIGWAEMKSLLIISGAFGLFERRIIAEVGGYLTTSAFKKDTVGEDMELVVRITKQAYDHHLNFRVDYIYNAICYTEVPQNFKSLRKQRNRWQRGLVDILSYHRVMIGNPKYKQVGLLGTPYFFLFEMFGPLIEIQGILALIISGVLGLLSLNIVLLLMLTSIGLGITLSLFALLVTERDQLYLSKQDTFRLVLIAIFENFGWRQFISMYRIVGFIASMRKDTGWGHMVRTGFQNTK
jgi:cellulose synthase/poly-beta-1,6-N-acetylglucosamine synthase-like glycosyltransferase